MTVRTSASARCMKFSTALPAPFATALTNNGSNLAASNSLTIALAVANPSFAVGADGGREVKDAAREEEIENAEETESERRLVERVR